MSFTAFEKRAIINVAKSVYPIKNKINTIENKIEKLQMEKQGLMNQIEAMEQTIAPIAKGLKSSAYVAVVPTATGANKYMFIEPKAHHFERVMQDAPEHRCAHEGGAMPAEEPGTNAHDPMDEDMCECAGPVVTSKEFDAFGDAEDCSMEVESELPL